MPKTITRLFASLDDARTAVAELERIGVRYAEISVISRAADGRHLGHRTEHLGDHDPIIGEEAKKGAEGGAVVGAAVGVLGGLPLLAVPGLGPVLAIGWLVATLGTAVGGAAVGTAAGGLVATLTNHGIDETDAHVFSEGVRRGETLVSARVDDGKYDDAAAVMNRLRAADATSRAETYRSGGWTKFDPNAVPPELPATDRAPESPT